MLDSARGSTRRAQERTRDSPPDRGRPRARTARGTLARPRAARRETNARRLVHVRHASAKERRGGVYSASTRDRDGRADRVAFLGHRRRYAAVTFPRLADLRLRQQDDVERDLRDSACSELERRPELGDARAVAVPRRNRARELQLVRECFGELESVVTERGQRAGGSSELRRKPIVANRGKR